MIPAGSALDPDRFAAAIAAADGPLPPRFPPAPRAGAFTVLDISKAFAPTSGGVRTYLTEKAAYVAARPELRQVLVVPGPGDALVEAGGVRCYRLRGAPIPSQHPYRLLWAPRTTRRILEHERPAIVEVGSPFFVPWNALLANRRLRLPMVWFYHSNLPHLLVPTPERHPVRAALHAAAWAYTRRLAGRFARVLVASDFVAGELRAHGIDRLARVPLGVSLARFDPARAAGRAATRRAYGLPDDAPLAVYAGRLAHEKRIDVPLRAWPEVERRTGARLVLVGDGPSAARLRALPGAERAFWIPFERDRDRLADLLAACDLYLAPGPAETFGLAALEGMASGLPVLSVARGAVPELVRRAGAGELYPHEDVAACADAAVGLLDRDPAALGRAARTWAERHHAWDVVFDRLFEVYREVAAECD